MAPPRFDDLPPDEQARIRSTSAQLSWLAQSYANFLLIGESVGEAPKWNLASCFAVRLRRRPLLVTAAHVFRKYQQRREENSAVFAQVGRVPLVLEKRVIVDDDKLDIAVFDLSGTDLSWLQREVYECDSLLPPRSIRAGDYVQFCGYPAYYREDVGPRASSLAALAGFVEVVDAQSGYIYCYRDRDYLIEFGPGPLPPPLEVLGGLSGGPVLFRSQLHYPVVGLVSEFMPSLDTFKCAIFTEELLSRCLEQPG